MTHIVAVNSVREVNELVEKILVRFLITKEEERLHLFAAIELIGDLTSIVDISAFVDWNLLILLLIKCITRSICVEIVVCKCADIGEVIAIFTPMQDLTKENNKLEFIAQVQRL